MRRFSQRQSTCQRLLGVRRSFGSCQSRAACALWDRVREQQEREAELAELADESALEELDAIAHGEHEPPEQAQAARLPRKPATRPDRVPTTVTRTDRQRKGQVAPVEGEEPSVVREGARDGATAASRLRRRQSVRGRRPNYAERVTEGIAACVGGVVALAAGAALLSNFRGIGRRLALFGGPVTFMLDGGNTLRRPQHAYRAWGAVLTFAGVVLLGISISDLVR